MARCSRFASLGGRFIISDSALSYANDIAGNISVPKSIHNIAIVPKIDQ